MSNYGAGTGNAGLEPAGEYVLPAIDAARNVTPPAALLFDGATRDAPLDDNGRYESIHPVDQAVALALVIRKGSLAGAPDIGSRFREITKIVRSTPNQVRSFVDQALATLVAAKSIQILRVDVETNTTAGSIAIAVQYRNLRTAQTKTARTTS